MNKPTGTFALQGGEDVRARFTVKDYAALSPEDQQAFMATLEPFEAAHLAYDWRFWARDDQLPPDDPDWLYWMLLAGRGAGKALALDTPLPTVDGWTTMGAVKVGDRLFDETGTPCRVMAVHPVTLGRECFVVRFSDGSEIVADGDHLWTTLDRVARRNMQRSKAWSARTLTTREIAAKVYDGREVNHAIPVAGPLDLPHAELPISPYVLGAWLGNGSSADATITTADPELIAEIEREGEQIGRVVEGRGCRTYHVGGRAGVRCGTTGRMIPNGSLHSRLSALGLLKNKHIPAAYLRASADQRLALLQGLMDTDGHCDLFGRCEFTSTRYELAKGAHEIAISLGLKATIREGRATLDGRDCGPKWRVSFTAYIPVFRVPRKLERMRGERGQVERQRRRYIVAVEPVPSVPVRCITVDSPSRLYLCGRQMIPTHNTRAGAEWVRDMVEVHWETPIQIALVGPTAADVRDVMVDGPSGLLSIFEPGKAPKYQPTRRRVLWPNGSKAFLYSAEQPDRLRGPQHHFAWCFIAGTMVATPDGGAPIETLKPGDMVLTRKGPRRVLGNSRRLASVGRVTFSHGRDLVGTADHPIYSGGQWRRLDHLRDGDPVCVIAASNGAGLAGISTAQAGAPTTSGQTRAAAFGAASASIARCGARLTATFRRAWMSITSTATARTTTSPIWPWSITPATVGSIGHSRSHAVIGVASSLACSFVTTAALPSPASGRGLQSASPASIDAQRTSVASSGPAFIAGARSQAAPETIAASVVSTWRPVGERFVFCLKVEGEPEYFANGVLVHNCDELAAWQYGQDTWDMLQFGLRLGEHPRAVITTTPRPIKLVRDLVNDPACRISTASTYDNLANLAPVFLDRIVRRYEGTRLGMQELYAKLLTDNPDALWTLSQLEGLRVARPPQDLDRIVVAVDPPTTSGENADECGIVVAGCRGKDWRTREAFVLADASSQGEKPNKWAWRVINTAKLYGADAIIVETNQGGEMVMETISALDRSIPIKGVHASKGKYTRAEPVAAFYEQGRVHHVGHLAKLEDQMANMTIDFDPQKAGFSPDRLDACVYALTDLLNPPGRAGSRSQ